MSQPFPILVVGGGPSGLAAALTLAQNGVPVRIVEKTTTPHNASRGTGIHPRTLEVARFLGIHKDFYRLGDPPQLMRAYKLPGGVEPVRTWSLLEKVEPTPDRPMPGTMLSQYLTEGIFRDHLAKCGVSVEMGTEVVSLEQDTEGVDVTVKKISQVGEESTEVIRAAYVVGADGARGFSRKAIGAVFAGQTKEEDGQVWADVIADAPSDYWHIWAVPGKITISMRAMRPQEDSSAFQVGLIGQGFNPEECLEQARFTEFFYEQTGRKDIIFKKFSSLMYWKPKVMVIDKFSDGRVFIVGDAAHVHSPTGGQGLNTSVQDAFNVAWKLALVHKGLASSDLLTTYETERLPVVTHMLMTTSNLYTHAVPKKAEDVKATGRTGAFLQWNNKALSQLDINYRWSPIVYDSRGADGLDVEDMKARAYQGYPGGDIRAGDRAPDAPDLRSAGGGSTSLFDIFKPNVHTVLLFLPTTGADTSAITQVVEAYPVGTIKTVVLGPQSVPDAIDSMMSVHDKEGHAVRAYKVDVNRLTVVIVRPDGYIGAFVYDAAGMQTYFAKILRCV